MLVIGLTGGIGSGKSTAAQYFRELGVPVIDADDITRELVEPGQPALTQVRATFGESVVTPNGLLDRGRLRDIVFQDAELRKRLEAILHPQVRIAIEHRVAKLNAGYCVVVIPLLFESGQNDLVQRVLVVDADAGDRKERVMRRDGVSAEHVEAIMHAQLAPAERLAHADDVLRNDAGPDELRAAVRRLHERYTQLAKDS